MGDGGGTSDRNKPDFGQNRGPAVSEGSSTAGIVAAVLALIAAIAGLIGIVAVPANSNFGARR